MSKVITLLIIVGFAVGGWFGYQKYLAPPSPAYLAYQQFAEAMARENYDKAEGLAAGAARERVTSFHQGSVGTDVKIYGQTLSMRPPSIREIAGDVFSIRWQKQSEQKSQDGNSATLVVIETVCRIPPGVSSAMCKWPVDFQHEAEVLLEGGSWKVASFTETRITP